MAQPVRQCSVAVTAVLVMGVLLLLLYGVMLVSALDVAFGAKDGHTVSALRV